MITHAADSFNKLEACEGTAETCLGSSSGKGMTLSSEDNKVVKGKELSASAVLREPSSNRSTTQILKEKRSLLKDFITIDEEDDFVCRPYGCGLCAEMFEIEKEFLEHCYYHYREAPESDTFLELFEWCLLSYVPQAVKTD